MTEPTIVTQTTPQALGSSSILGSKLSIITTAQVRYEGILTSVDPVNKAMILIKVKSFGTEGRRGGTNEILGNDNEIAEVTFKVDLIKDFKIIEKPTALNDPAIISISEIPTAYGTKQIERAVGSERAGEEQKGDGFYSNFQQASYPGGRKKESGYARDNFKQKPKYRKEPQLSQLDKDNNFNFEAHRLKEEEAANTTEKAEGGEAVEGGEVTAAKEGESPAKPKYEPTNDFFDSISNST